MVNKIIAGFVVGLAHAASAQDVTNLSMTFRPSIEEERKDDVEFCVIHFRCSEEWREGHKVEAKMGDNELSVPVVLRSSAKGLRKNKIEASASAVKVNGIPVNIILTPPAEFEVVFVAFETFEDVLEDGGRALVTRFTCQPISEIDDYTPLEPGKMRFKMSSFMKYKPAEPFPDLKQLLEGAKSMPSVEAP